MGNDSVELPVLTSAETNTLREHGSSRMMAAGEVLYRQGDSEYDFYAVVSGAIETVVQADDVTARVIRRQGAGNFTGELDLLTNRRAFVTNRVSEAGEVVAVPRAEVQAIVATHTSLGDKMLKAFIERRRRLQSQAASTTRVIGSRHSAHVARICEFLSRQSIPHEWLDPDVDDLDGLLDDLEVSKSDLPIVVATGTVLRNPSAGELGDYFGLVVPELRGQRYDVAIVGAGPSGLASAVYAASEGLSTLCVDSFAVGGQAGTSSRIENYLGFPTGISGADLAYRAAIQAEKFGVRLSTPCRVESVHIEGGWLVLRLTDGSEVAARAVIAASGAKYQRLQVDHLEQFEGTGVYYAATKVEAKLCGEGPAVVVGGGNSAGQAALFLAESGCSVVIAIRGDDIESKMSRYLTSRLVAHANVTIRTGTHITALHQDDGGCLASIDVTDRDGGSTIPCGALFSFIGAAPSASWLPEAVARDARGFILTDRALRGADLSESWQALGRQPLPYETSLAGLFAVGDVRSSSPKRVAAAVGEGSACISSVHAFLNHAG